MFAHVVMEPSILKKNRQQQPMVWIRFALLYTLIVIWRHPLSRRDGPIAYLIIAIEMLAVGEREQVGCCGPYHLRKWLVAVP